MFVNFKLTADQERNLNNLIILACYALIISYFILAIYLISGLWTNPGLFYITGNPVGADFIQLWAASSLALQGNSQSIYSPEAIKIAETAIVGGTFKGYLSCHLSPSFLLLLMPISCIPYLVALFIWLAFPLAALLILLWKIAPYRIVFPLILAFPAIPLNLFYGQGAFLITFLMGAGLLLLDCRPIISGTLFSIILNYKPHLGLLILVALFAGRYWKVCGTIALITLGIVLVSGWIMGMDTWVAYIENISYASSILKNEAHIWDRMPTIFALVRLQNGSVRLAMVLQLIVAMGTIVVILKTWSSDNSLPLRGSFLVLGTFLVSPYAFEYDLTLLLLPLTWLAVKIFQKGWLSTEGLLFILLWYSPILDKLSVHIAGLHIVPLIISIFMVIMMRSKGAQLNFQSA
jgi:hypothetical protein